MKTLIRKELRENLVLTVLGLLVFGLIVSLGYRDYENTMKHLALGSTDVRGPMQPLAEGSFQISTAFFCGIFAALLGWFQAFHERHRDLWSYLVHRPVSRSRIFQAKVVAGAGLYAVAAGLPLLGFIGWARIPGHVAAPFEWPILWPILIFFLAGMVSYFAGMLTCLRQARWYASRGLPLGMGLTVTVAAGATPRPGQALLLLAIGGAILATATWASFQTNGFYRGQRWAGRLTLPAVLMFGSMPVAFMAMGLLQVVMPQWMFRDFSWSYYQMTRDGTIYKVTSSNVRPVSIVDLEGHPLMDSKTGRPIEFQQFAMRSARSVSLNTDIGKWAPSYIETAGLAGFYRVTPNTLWFYWQRYGRLVAFDVLTRRPTGSLGPNGFTPDLAGGGQRFTDVPGEPSHSFPTLHTASVLYHIDLENRTSAPIFTTDKDDMILDSGTDINLDAVTVEVGVQAKHYAALLTRRSARLLTMEGNPIWEAPYHAGYRGSAQVQVWVLQPTGNYALWVTPTRAPDRHEAGSEPTQVTWFADGRNVKAMELPKAESDWLWFRFQEKFLGVTMPPLVFGLGPIFLGEPWPDGYWRSWRIGCLGLVVGALVCIPVGWWLGRRYSLPPAARMGWVGFLLLTGLPGLLAFLSVQEWPAREPCPKCGRGRIVERAQCEHCGAPFPPPERIGIEIFEGTPVREQASIH